MISRQCHNLKEKTELQSKIIDLMAKEIMVADNLICEFDFEKWETKEEVKQYFENKAKEK